MNNQNHSGTGDNVIAENYYANIAKHPSILADVIGILTPSINLEDIDDQKTTASFSIDSKISHNNVITYQEIFNSHKIFQGKLDVIYDELEIDGKGKKTALLININSIYLKLKGELIKNEQDKNFSIIDLIRINSDNIISKIEKHLLELYLRSDNNNTPFEMALISLRIVIVDAFMRCKILEEV